MNRRRVLVLGAILSVVFLWLALNNVDWSLLISNVKTFRWGFLPLMVGLVLLDLVSRSIRWGVLLPPGPRNRFRLFFRLESIGLGLNNILPFRLGELGRTVLAAQELEVPFLTVLATVVVERVLDALSLLALFVFFGDWAVESKWITPLKETARAGLAVGAAGLIALIWLEGVLDRSPRMQSLLKKHPRFEHFLRQLILGTQSLRTWRMGLTVVACGLTLWVWDSLLIVVTSRAFGAASIGLPRAFTVLMVSAAAVSVPGVPGYFGAYELAVSRTLAKFDMAASAALPCAAFIHLTSFLVTTVLGIAFLYAEGHSLESLRRALDRKEAEPAAEAAPR